jgi:hypothetical protein
LGGGFISILFFGTQIQLFLKCHIYEKKNFGSSRIGGRGEDAIVPVCTWWWW